MALSGGGFRAAFFHVGVLSRLAERDLVQRVRTLSCVSGGSIAWLAVATLYVTLFLLTWRLGVYADSWVGMSWSHAEGSLLALGLFVVPALAPCLAWLLLSPEARAWRRIAP